MKEGKLTLLESTPEGGTLSALTINGRYVCLILERFWLGNQSNVSCIPPGRYVVERDNTGRHQYFRINNVPGRTHIEIHPGNDIDDSEGCQLPGYSSEMIGNKRMIYRSKDACDLISDIIGEDNQWLLDVSR